jgi:hypothetical protein
MVTVFNICKGEIYGHVQRKEENRIPKRVLYMNLEMIER